MVTLAFGATPSRTVGQLVVNEPVPPVESTPVLTVATSASLFCR